MMRSVIAIAVLLVSCSHLHAATVPRFQPATIATGEGSLSSNVRCPATLADQPLVMVSCQGKIDTTGEVSVPYCVADGDFPLYRKASLAAFKDSRFEPARVDGEPVEVYAAFRLAFQQREGGCAVGLLPNKGYGVQEFGLLYTEPQEIVSGKGWTRRDRTSNRVRRQRGGLMLILTSEVDADGVPGKVKVDKSFTASRADRSAIVKSARDARFIPGFVNGVPTPMTSYEYFYIMGEPVSESSVVEGAPAMSRGNP